MCLTLQFHNTSFIALFNDLKRSAVRLIISPHIEVWTGRTTFHGEIIVRAIRSIVSIAPWFSGILLFS